MYIGGDRCTRYTNTLMRRTRLFLSHRVSMLKYERRQRDYQGVVRTIYARVRIRLSICISTRIHIHTRVHTRNNMYLFPFLLPLHSYNIRGIASACIFTRTRVSRPLSSILIFYQLLYPRSFFTRTLFEPRGNREFEIVFWDDRTRFLFLMAGFRYRWDNRFRFINNSFYVYDRDETSNKPQSVK